MGMYTIHARCSLNVSDDSGGNVYVCAFDSDETHNDVKDYIRSNHVTNPAILRLPFGGGSPVDLSANIERIITDIRDPNSNVAATVDQPYYMYALAIDNYYNVSDLKAGSSNGNVIQQQAAPNTRGDLDALMTVEGNIAFSGNIYTTVPYDYQTVSFTYREPNVANIQGFFDNFVDNPVVVTDETVHALNNRDITDVFYNVTESNTDFDPFLDTTRDHYAYLYMRNAAPHDSGSNIEEHLVPRTNEPRGDITLSNPVHGRLRDVTANVSFDVGNVENTEYFVTVYNNPIFSPGTNGPFKRHIVTRGLHGTPTTSELTVSVVVHEFFHDEHDTLAKDLETRETYYLYVLLRDTFTGEYTRTPIEMTFTTGAPPVVKTTSTDSTRGTNYTITTVRTTVEEENVAGPNVYAIAFGDINANVTIDKFDVLRSKATLLEFTGPWSGQQEISGNLTSFYTNTDTVTTDASNANTKNKNWYIHLLLEDPMRNRDLFAPTTYNGLIAYEPVLASHDLYQQETRDSMLDATLSDPNTVLDAGNQTMEITFTFENTHKIKLSQLFLDLSNVQCSNISTVSVTADNANGISYNNTVTILGQSTDFEKQKVHAINFDTAGNPGVDVYSHFKLTLTSTESVVIAGLRFRGAVYDDRDPIFATTNTVSYTNSNVSFDLEDYSDVDARVFRSRHYWADPVERRYLFNRVTPQIQTGPVYTPTTVTFESAEDVLNLFKTTNYDDTETYDNSENYYTYLEMTDVEGNRAESKVFDNGGSNITALPFTSTPVPLLNDDAGIIQGFYNDINARTEIHVEGNVMDGLAPAKYAIEVYEKGTSHQQSPDISYDDWSNYNLSPNTVTDIVTNIGQTTDSSRIVENKTYTITLHAMNSLALHANVSLDVSLAEEDPVIRLQHLQYFAADSTIRADIHFTDNLSDAHVYGALFNEPFANVTVAQNFFDSNTSNTNIQKKQNVFNESFTFVFDRFYNVSTSSWVTSVSETSVYYMYVYARENRAENQNTPATKIRACAFGPPAGSFSVEQGTLTGSAVLLDGHPALVSAFTTTPSVLTTMVDNYLLVNIWIYPIVDAVLGAKIVETADFVLSHDATTFGTLVFQNKATPVPLITFANTTLVANVWNNLVLELQDIDVNLYVNGVFYPKSSDGLTYTSTSVLTLHGNVAQGVDHLYLSTFRPFETNPSFTRVAATDFTDTFPPSAFDLAATFDGNTSVRVRANIMDEFSANVKVALFDTYYGSVEPYANLDADLDQFFDDNVLITNSVPTNFMNRVSVDLGVGGSYANLSATSSVGLSSSGSHHAYMRVYDESARANHRVVYVSQVLGSDLTSEVPTVNRFEVSDGDDKIRNIKIVLDNVNPTDFEYALAAYPHGYKSAETDVVREDFVRVHMNAHVTLHNVTGITTQHPLAMTTYFTDETDTDGTTMMEYAVNYDVYTLVTNTTTKEQTLIANVAFTAVAPAIESLNISVENDYNIRITGNVVDESSNLSVYAAVFAPNIAGGGDYDETQIKDFFTNAEFVSEEFTKFKQDAVVSPTINCVLENYHKDPLFHDDVRSIVSSSPAADYKVVVYVKDHNHNTYNEFYHAADVRVVYTEDIDQPLIRSTNVTPNDLSANVAFQTEDYENNVDVRVVAFASNVSTTDARGFLRHANIEGVGFTVDDVSNVATDFDVRLDRALNLSFVSTTYDVDIDANGNVTLDGYEQPDIHMFMNQVYTFHLLDQSARFYLSTTADNTASAISGAPEISYITIDGSEHNVIDSESGLDNIEYVRYKAVTAGAITNLYYGLWDVPGKGGNITVLDSNDPTSFPVLDTTDNTRDYHAYVYARDNSRRENSNVVGLTYRVGAPPIIARFDANFVVI